MTKVCKTFMRRFDPGPRLQTFLPPQKNLILKHVGEPAHRFRVRIHPQVVA